MIVSVFRRFTIKVHRDLHSVQEKSLFKGVSCMGKLQDKVAIITGGASGIGAATAQLFVAEGAKVVLVDLNEEKGQAFAAELQATGAKAMFIKANVTDEQEVAAIYQTTIEAFGKVDVLFNNAGIGRVTPTEELPYAEWRQTVNVDLDGVFLMA